MYVHMLHIYIYIYIYVVSTSMDPRSGVLARLGDDVKLSNLVGPSQAMATAQRWRVERVDLQRQTAAYPLVN
jgi:hypothetical protein